MRGSGVEVDHWYRTESETPPADPAGYQAVLSLGGAMHVDQEDRNPWIAEEIALLAELLERDIPMLGLCLGSQLLAIAAGGSAWPARAPEIGWHPVELTAEGAADPLLGSLAPGFEAFEWHSYEFDLPPNAKALARSPICLQAYRIGDAAWGIQFHAEVAPADAFGWIEKHRGDEELGRSGIDVGALREETEARIGGWNRLGRELCGRFLDLVG
ncbi:MAG: type 1 glutamine amidotransferase [Solirubrobacterales bacterium]